MVIKMYIRINKNGTKTDSNVYLVQGYRDAKGNVKHRTLVNYGSLNKLQATEPNVLERLKKEAKIMTAEQMINLNISTVTSNEHSDEELIYGHFPLESIYNSLNIPSFIKGQSKDRKFNYDPNEVFKLLVLSRILNPDSKLGTYEERNRYFDSFKDLKLQNIYRSLNFFNDFKEDLQFHLHNEISKQYGRDVSLVFYDVTNYYFETELPDEDIIDNITGEVIEYGLRQKGVSKEHRPEPIVSMGLLIDNNGIPIGYKLFKGNTHDSKTLIPILNEIKAKYGLKRIILTADKGLNSRENLGYLKQQGDGYIVSQQIRRSKKEFMDEITNTEGYVYLNSDFKYKLITREREILNLDKTTQMVKEKVVIFWSKKYSDREKHKREKLREKLDNMINNPSKYKASNRYGLKKYLKEVKVDKATGEITKDQIKLIFDEEKYKRDEALDGYYAIITSELDLSAEEIIERYRGLWRIEESFRITKTDLEGRPVYVWTHDHIEAHFLTCFVSLTILRILQFKLKFKYSVEQIVDNLNKAKCIHIEQGVYILTKQPKLLQEILEIHGIEINKKYVIYEQLKKIKKKNFR